MDATQLTMLWFVGTVLVVAGLWWGGFEGLCILVGELLSSMIDSMFD